MKLIQKTKVVMNSIIININNNKNRELNILNVTLHKKVDQHKNYYKYANKCMV